MPKIRGIDIPKESDVKNFIINGDMKLSQRNTTFTAIAAEAYSLDRFQYSKSGAMVHTITQDTDVPTFAQSGYSFQNSMRLNLTTPDTAIATTDYIRIQQKVEGFNWANLTQKNFILGFWVKATLAGVYTVSFTNAGQDRSYVAEYTINSSATWEYKTILVPAAPVAGTWNYANGIGLWIQWTLSGGTQWQTTAGSWQTGNFFSSPNQVNGTNTGATDFRMTGITLNEGLAAIPFHLFGEDREGEIAACQRYYCKSNLLASPVPFAGDANGMESKLVNSNTVPDQQRYGSTSFPVVMRTAPSMNFYSLDGTVNRVSDAIGATLANGSGTAQFIGDRSFNTYNNSGGSVATSVFNLIYHWAANAEL